MSIHYGKNIKTRYFKGYINNFTTVGTPTFDGSVVSGFSSSNYLTMPEVFNPENNPWETVFCFTLTSGVTQFITGNYWTHSGSNIFYGYIIQCYNSNVLVHYGFGTASPIEHTFTPTLNTKYWIKSVYDGSSYASYYSTDGIEYNLIDTTQSSSIIVVNPSYPQHIGVIYNGYSNGRPDPFLGSIDLSECHIQINGETWWSGYKRCKYDYNFTTVGTPSISAQEGTCEVSNFSSANYLKTIEAPSDVSSFEFGVKFTTGSTITKQQGILANSSTNIYTPQLIIDDTGYLEGLTPTKVGTWGSEINTPYVLEANTTYWAKYGWDGEQCYLDVSLDGEIYERVGTVTHSSIGWTEVMGIGIDQTSNPFLGSIDLTQSYIKINGEFWWTCFKQSDEYVFTEESTKEDYDYTIFKDGKIGHFYRGDLYRIDHYKGYINNFITVGTPTISKSMASGFTTVNNYLLIPAIPANTTNFETILKVRFNNNTTNQHFFNTSHTYGFLLSLSNAGKLFVHISGNGSSWNIASNIHGTTVLSKDTWYYVRCSFDGLQYKVQLSTDKEIWTDEITINSTLTVGSVGGGRIGSGWQQDTPGSYVTFDLNECYIKVNDEYFWKAYKRCIYDYNFTTVGLPSVFTQEGRCTVSGFSDSNYLTLLENFDVSDGSTWEKVFKFTTGSDISTAQTIIGCNVDNRGHVVQFSSGKFRLFLSSATSWDIASNTIGSYTVLADTTYYIKLEFTGSAYNLYYSLDGVDYILDITINNSKPLSQDLMRIGETAGSGQYLLGSIDLSESYIKVNNELWWSCFKTSTDYVFTEKSTADDYDFTKPYKGEIILGYKGETLVYSLYPEGVVFEENTAGTYTISPAISGPYEISLVGPGSGGTAAGDQPSYASKSRGAGGGSGAYVKGIWNLTRGVDYTIVVGAGGPAGPTNSNNGYSQAAGDSSFGDIIVCGGGGGATAVWKGSGIGGAGGTVKACENPIQLITRTAGNQGSAGGGYTYYEGGASKLPPHGAGGYGQATGNYAGKSSGGENGYCLVRMVKDEDVEIINANFVGNANYDKGFVNNFTTSNYLMLQETLPIADEIEFGGKISLAAKSTATKCIYEISTSSWTGFNIALDSSSRLRLWTSSQTATGSTLEANTDYWFKCVCNSKGSILYLSTDGVEYTQNITITNNQYSSWVNPNVYLGVRGYNKTEPLTNDVIDLNDCYVKVNNGLWWKGIITVKPYTFTINTKLENATIIINGEERNTITALGGNMVTYSITYQGYLIEKGQLLLTEDTEIHIKDIEFVPWEQPTLTSNTSYGTLTGSSYSGSRYYYCISDGKIPTTNDASDNWGTNNTAIGWVNWELPEEIIIKGIKIYNRSHTTAVDYQLTGARFYTDSTKETPIGEEFEILTSQGIYELKDIPPEGIQTKNIYFYKTGSTYSGIGELEITAERIVKTIE